MTNHEYAMKNHHFVVVIDKKKFYCSFRFAFAGEVCLLPSIEGENIWETLDENSTIPMIVDETSANLT